VLLRKRYTLAAEMFGVGDFWLEIQEPLTDFHKKKQKNCF
jgi:hypothetical protein